jgi:putative aminopeptidase FrvX
MHTTVEMVEKQDVENTIKLMYECVCKLEKWQSFNYL